MCNSFDMDFSKTQHNVYILGQVWAFTELKKPSNIKRESHVIQKNVSCNCVFIKWNVMLKEQSFVKKAVRKYLGLISPKLLASVDVYRNMRYWINWKQPRDLNEKILWQSLNSDTSKWTELADKYAVRQYLNELGYNELLPTLYGVWENADEIDFDSLPESFILKTNHGSGTNIIVKNKSELNIPETREKMNQWLKLKFGWPYEPHYLRIKPKIIAEQLLDVNKQSIKTTSLIDYKLFCLDGHVDLIWSCYNRTGSSVYVDTHKPDWSYHPELSVFSDQYRDGKNLVPPPHQS